MASGPLILPRKPERYIPGFWDTFKQGLGETLARGIVQVPLTIGGAFLEDYFERKKQEDALAQQAEEARATADLFNEVTNPPGVPILSQPLPRGPVVPQVPPTSVIIQPATEKPSVQPQALPPLGDLPIVNRVLPTPTDAEIAAARDYFSTPPKPGGITPPDLKRIYLEAKQKSRAARSVPAVSQVGVQAAPQPVVQPAGGQVLPPPVTQMPELPIKPPKGLELAKISLESKEEPTIYPVVTEEAKRAMSAMEYSYNRSIPLMDAVVQSGTTLYEIISPETYKAIMYRYRDNPRMQAALLRAWRGLAAVARDKPDEFMRAAAGLENLTRNVISRGVSIQKGGGSKMSVSYARPRATGPKEYLPRTSNPVTIDVGMQEMLDAMAEAADTARKNNQPQVADAIDADYDAALQMREAYLKTGDLRLASKMYEIAAPHLGDKDKRIRRMIGVREQEERTRGQRVDEVITDAYDREAFNSLMRDLRAYQQWAYGDVTRAGTKARVDVSMLREEVKHRAARANQTIDAVNNLLAKYGSPKRLKPIVTDPSSQEFGILRLEFVDQK